MPKLTDSLRVITSTVNDDFYEDEDLLSYINHSKKEVVSYYINKERDRKRSLRVLDILRETQEIDLSSATYQTLYDFYYTDVGIDNTAESIHSVINNDSTPCREITWDRINMIHLGNLQPTKAEHYYTVSNSTDGENNQTQFTFYVDSDTNTKSVIYYINQPKELSLEDTLLVDLPERLRYTVLYKSAQLLSIEESQKNLDQSPDYWNKMYLESLKNNEY